MTTPPITHSQRARDALAQARRLRSAALIAVAEGRSTPTEVILHAMTDEGRYLRILTLRELLHAQHGWSGAKATRMLGRIRAILETTDDLTTKTISWLIDPKCGGRRLIAWLDIHAHRTTPWPGFPFTPQPPNWALPPAKIATPVFSSESPEPATTHELPEAAAEPESTGAEASAITDAEPPPKWVDPWEEQERLLKSGKAMPAPVALEAVVAARQSQASDGPDPWAVQEAELLRETLHLPPTGPQTVTSS